MAIKQVNLGKKGKFEMHPGALHRNLGIPAKQKIGPARIAAAEHSSNPTIRKEADSAAGFEHMHHKLGAQHVFGRGKQPTRPTAPEAAGPDKDAAIKQKKMGASDIFGRRR